MIYIWKLICWKDRPHLSRGVGWMLFSVSHYPLPPPPPQNSMYHSWSVSHLLWRYSSVGLWLLQLKRCCEKSSYQPSHLVHRILFQHYILYTYLYFSFLCNSATAPSGPGLLHCRGFTIALRRTTLGRTHMEEWSSRRRDLYLTTHNTHKRQTSTPPSGFEAAIPASERPQTHALDRAATGLGAHIYILVHNSSQFVTVYVCMLFRRRGHSYVTVSQLALILRWPCPARTLPCKAVDCWRPYSHMLQLQELSNVWHDDSRRVALICTYFHQ
jgi:hypothetical protein